MIRPKGGTAGLLDLTAGSTWQYGFGIVHVRVYICNRTHAALRPLAVCLQSDTDLIHAAWSELYGQRLKSGLEEV